MATKRKSSGGAPSSSSSGSSSIQKTSLDVDALRSVVELLEASDVTHLSWKRGEERLLIRRGYAPAPAPVAAPAYHPPPPPPPPASSSAPSRPTATAAAPVAAVATEKPGQLVTSPFVGTFYRTPAPEQPSFVEVGSVVKKGQVLCIVEAMKLMNEIESETAGTITEILAQNGQAVEFGQSLFRIEPL
jgi:acetyl-CoA carboxylase biotin carboxyl carrier protein